jgi:competence protein ComEC
MPLAPLALAFAAGIALAPWLSRWQPWTVGALASVATAMLAFAGRIQAATIALLAAVTVAGVIRGTPPPLPVDHVARLELPMVADVEGAVVGEPVRGRGRVRTLLDVTRVDGERRSGRIQLGLFGRAPELVAGQRVRGQLRVAHPVGFRNPGGFDHAAYLARRGIHAAATGHGDALTVLDTPPTPWRARVKRAALAAMDTALPPASAALLGGLLLGERTALPPEIQDGFRAAGVYHVLAVSGFNVALVAASALAILTLARLGPRAAALGAGIAVVGFAIVVGPEPSVVRATLMGVLVLGARLLDREASVLNGLAFAALAILVARPGDLLDPGFQLSFAATLGIILIPHPHGTIAGALSVSLAAQLAVLPITLAHFNQVSLVGPLANLGAVPLAAVATVLGLLGAGLAFVVPGVADLLFQASWPVLLGLRAVAAAAAAVPGALVHLPAPSGPAIAAYAGACGLALAAWRGRAARPRRAVVAAGAAATLLAVAVGVGAWPLLPRQERTLRLSVLDVGDADAVVVEPPGGGAILVEGGSGRHRLDAMERVVAPFLWNRGVLRLAALARTRADDEAPERSEDRRVSAREVWTRDSFGAGPRLAGGMLVSAVAGTPLVLRIDFGRASFLLAGDASVATERALASAGALARATVVLVPRHGAREASTPAFVRTVAATAAIVSVGARGAHGHPDAETLARWTAAGARVFRTDRDGAVLLETDGRVLTIAGFATGARERYCLDPDQDC